MHLPRKPLSKLAVNNTRQTIIEGLHRYGLSELPGRPYDCSFELLAAPLERKRLIMVGFNGSSADKKQTNSQSVTKDYERPYFSNVRAGTEGEWGIKHLANRLQQIPQELGYRWEDVIYTNSLLMCSSSAHSLKTEVIEQEITVEYLVKNSMNFFENITIPLCKPELIIAYSNGLSSLSAASLLMKHFGDVSTLRHSHAKGYYTTYAFKAQFRELQVPVVCIRHMSRFKPNVEYIKEALRLVG